MWAYAIIMAVSAIVQAYSSISAANAQAAASRAQAMQEEENAKIAEAQANRATDQGEAQKDAVRLKLAEMRAQGRTGYAAGNVALGAGTPAEYEVDLAQRAQMDLDTIDTNTSLEAWGFRTNAVSHRNQANILKSEAKNTVKAGYWKAAGSLLSSASSVAGAYGGGAGGSNVGGGAGGFNVGGALGSSTGTGGGYNMGGGRVSGL